MLVFVVFVCLLTGCDDSKSASSGNSGSDKKVLEAIEFLADKWNEDYEDRKIDGKYLEIINTRIIYIKDDIDPEKVHGKDDLFKDIDYIVEFELMSNYMNTAPYYFNAKIKDNVIVYKDGTLKLDSSFLRRYIASTYSLDVSPFIETIKDFDDRYNRTIKFR